MSTTTAKVPPRPRSIAAPTASTFAHVPAALRSLNNWVCWKYVLKSNKWTKVPLQAKTGRAAAVDDPSTWCDYDTALQAYINQPQRFDGIGFVFAPDDEFIGIDLDDVMIEGAPTTEAAGILSRINSYAEISPSGEGVKITAIGQWPEKVAHKKKLLTGGEIEVYDHARFFTVTGRSFANTPAEPQDANGSLSWIIDTYFQTPKPVKKKPAPRPTTYTSTPADEVAIAVEAIEHLSFARADGNYNAWLAVLMAAHSVSSGPEMLRACINFSRLSPKFHEGEVETKWAGFTPKPSQIGELITWAKHDCPGWKPRRPGSNGHAKAKSAKTSAAAGSTPDAIILDSSAPLANARYFRNTYFSHQDCPTLHFASGTFHQWNRANYAEAPTDQLRAGIYGMLDRAQKARVDKQTGEVVLQEFKPKKADVDNILDGLRAEAYLDVAPPAWIGAAAGLPDPRDILVARNGLIVIDDKSPHLFRPPTPLLFTMNALDYDFAPNASTPKAWLSFLDTIFPEDDQSIALVQEWFGYVLTLDTRQQKMLMLVGPKRSGKGTIARTLTSLIGPANVCAPTLAGIASNFGMQSFIGKQLAIIGDARLSGRSDQAIVVERLLSISGEDSIDIDRKHLAPLTVKLPTRVMCLTNELPRLTDSSGALASRFLMLILTESYFGREDLKLQDRILAELPGILLWSIEGWQRLKARGYFVQPSASAEAINEMADLCSPIAAFVRDYCIISDAGQIAVAELFAGWQLWCKGQGRDHAGTLQIFGRDLPAAFPRIGMVQPRQGEERIRTYRGIDLNPRIKAEVALSQVTQSTHCPEDAYA